MRQLNKMPVAPTFKALFLALAVTLTVSVGCSAGKPITISKKIQGGQQDERVGNNSAREGDVVLQPNALEDESTPLPQEVVGQALIALSTLPSDQVARLSSDNLADVSVRGKCGFVSSTSQVDAVLKDSAFVLDASLVRYSSLTGESESISFEDCRCLVAETERKLGIALLPVSTF